MIEATCPRCGAEKTNYEDQCSWECGTRQSLIGGSHIRTPEFKLIESEHCRCRQSLASVRLERDDWMKSAAAERVKAIAAQSQLAAATKRADEAERELALTKNFELLELTAAKEAITAAESARDDAVREAERLKTKWESGEEWFIYHRDRGDARIRGPYQSNIIASAVRDEMETYGQYGDDNLVIMTEPKERPAGE